MNGKVNDSLKKIFNFAVFAYRIRKNLKPADWVKDYCFEDVIDFGAKKINDVLM